MTVKERVRLELKALQAYAQSAERTVQTGKTYESRERARGRARAYRLAKSRLKAIYRLM